MSLTRAQVEQLLQPIRASRVLKDRDGLSHVSQQDIRAHLSRVFGFGGWSTEILELSCVRDTIKAVPAKNGKPARDVPDVTYLCRLRLTIRDPQGEFVASYEDVGTGTSPNLPTHGDAHDFAAKNAVSYALKRCATNLGDGFGLSLYNRGQLTPLVMKTLVMPDGEAEGDVQKDVPQQVDMGDEQPAEEPEAPSNGHAESIDPTVALRAGIWNVAKAKGWSTADVETDFAKENDNTAFAKAKPEQLTAYLKLIRDGVVS